MSQPALESASQWRRRLVPNDIAERSPGRRRDGAVLAEPGSPKLGITADAPTFAGQRIDARHDNPSVSRRSSSATPSSSPSWQSSQSGRSKPARAHSSPLVLRVLSGVQRGAHATMRHQRLLVGNLESECDVVIDVGRPHQHACLIRVSKDGWTVLAVAGDLWAGESRVAPHQTQAIVAGDILTLGEVSFCLAEASIDWTQLQIPDRRQDPAINVGHPGSDATLVGRDDGRRRGALATFARRLGWATQSRLTERSTTRLSPRRSNVDSRTVIGFLLVAGIALAALAVYLVSSLSAEPVPAAMKNTSVETAGAVLGKFAWAHELTLQFDLQTRRVVISGYLPRRAQAIELQQAMRQRGVDLETHWAVVDELMQELSHRLVANRDDVSGASSESASNDTLKLSHNDSLSATSKRLRYNGQGRFSITDTRANLAVIDPSIRRALQDMPQIAAIELRLTRTAIAGTADDPSSTPVVVDYRRADGAPGGVVVTGMNQLPPAKRSLRYGVREIRIGRLSSVVLDDGARYFEGASLPGGGLLNSIQADRLLVQFGNDIRQVDLVKQDRIGAQPASLGPNETAPTSDVQGIRSP